MNIQTSEELQAKAMEMSKEHIEISQYAGLVAMQGFASALEDCDEESLEARKLGAMIAATDFLETCQVSVLIYDDSEGDEDPHRDCMQWPNCDLYGCGEKDHFTGHKG